MPGDLTPSVWRDEDEPDFFPPDIVYKGWVMEFKTFPYLWVDDERSPPIGEPWIWVKNAADAIEEICASSRSYQLVSLDHDLGDEDPHSTGYAVLCAVERQIAKGGWWGLLPHFRIHSANPVGRANMARAIDSIHRMAYEMQINAYQKEIK